MLFLKAINLVYHFVLNSFDDVFLQAYIFLLFMQCEFYNKRSMLTCIMMKPRSWLVIKLKYVLMYYSFKIVHLYEDIEFQFIQNMIHDYPKNYLNILYMDICNII